MSDKQLREQGRLQGLRDSGSADPGSAGGPPPRGRGIAAGLTDQQLGIGAAVVATVVFALWRRAKSAAPSGTTATPGAAYDSTQSDQWNQFQQMYEGLQQQIDGLHPVDASPMPAPPPDRPAVPALPIGQPPAWDGISSIGSPLPSLGPGGAGGSLPPGVSGVSANPIRWRP